MSQNQPMKFDKLINLFATITSQKQNLFHADHRTEPTVRQAAAYNLELR